MGGMGKAGKNLIHTVLGGVFLLAPAAGHAQQNNGAPAPGYAPPTMFEAPPVAAPRPDKAAIIPQIYSPNVDLDDKRDANPAYIKPRVSRSSGQAPAPAAQPYVPEFQPVPPKPMEQTPVGREMRAIEQKAVPVPPVPPSAPAPSRAAVAPVATPQKGAVTGPKVMPAVPAQNVEAEQVFTPPAQPEAKTLMEKHRERQQQAQESQKPAAPPPSPAPAPVPAAKPAEPAKKEAAPRKAAAAPLAAAPQAASPAPAQPSMGQDKTLRLLFAAGSPAPDPAQLSSVNSNILTLMKDNPALRVYIRAFASPVDTSQSSDRRIALSRALAVRSFLIDQGVEARRIDVRALGAQSDQGPADRVDLVLSSAN